MQAKRRSGDDAVDPGGRSRVRRQEEDEEEVEMTRRVGVLAETDRRIEEIKDTIRELKNNLKKSMAQFRSNVSEMDVGVAFNPASTLELRNPDNLQEMAVNTKVSFYANVTRRAAAGGDRAFLFYMGNEEDTHTKMPRTDTDDFMALEVVEDGRVKLTADMGAGMAQLQSNLPIAYGQWNYFEIDRQGFVLTLTVSMEQGPGEVTTDTQVGYLPRYDAQRRPFGSVFNLHPDYSRIFVGGFPASARIQDVVRETFMEGQVEGLRIGGQALGLFNYRAAVSIVGAPGRNKFKEKPETGVRFSGSGFLALDRSDYVEMEEELAVRLRFKPESADGALLVAGDETEGDFVALEMRARRLVYSFNLGDGTAELSTDEPLEVDAWHSAEIRRNGRLGRMEVDGTAVGEAEAQGQMVRLSITSDIYVGGFPGGGAPFAELAGTVNFTGCVEDLYLGPDPADFGRHTQRIDTKEGCVEEEETMAYFPPATPGFVQLKNLSLMGSFEISFMFRTGQRRSVLMYAVDTGRFHYISLSLFDGALHLKVFLSHEINTDDAAGGAGAGASAGSAGGKAETYNDNEWHTVSVAVTKTYIEMHIDDHAYFRTDVSESDQMPHLDADFKVYLGGLAEDVTVGYDSAASEAPYIGCLRDVVIGGEVVLDLNRGVERSPGVQKGICKVELPAQTGDGDSGEPGEPGAPGGSGPGAATGDGASGGPGEEEEVDSGWGDLLRPPTGAPAPDKYGDCKLPLAPAPDPDVGRTSGLRFGTKRDTYLEFHKKLKIKKRSEFSLELKTTFEDGIVFYVADETHTDFVALLIKEGRLVYGFNCGSGSVFIETEQSFADGQWHRVEFSRQGERGKLFVDGHLRGEQDSYGTTKSIEVAPEFFLGGVKREVMDDPAAQRNLMKLESGFVGCLRDFRLRGKPVGKWSRNNKSGVVPCSDKVEPGVFIGPGGGSILAARKFRVGLDFDVTMQIKPRNVSGILLAIQGRRDFLILQMIDGTLTFTVDNGRGPITAFFKPPDSTFQFCDGRWHDIHAVKAKNVVTLSVDGAFANPGIGVPGVSSTDTNHGLFIGGHQKADRLTGRRTDANFVGCIKDVVIERVPLKITQAMLRGDVTSHVCPTI